MSSDPPWPALAKDDEGLHEELFELLKTRVQSDPYAGDGGFAAEIAALPPGLRAMAATHWLDLSLTLDSLCWHFGNFGEPALAAATETGLRELGLDELAACFAEAKELMAPLLAEWTKEVGFDETLDRAGKGGHARSLDARAWALHKVDPERSSIYDAWIRYTRRHPERVFGPAPSNSAAGPL